MRAARSHRHPRAGAGAAPRPRLRGSARPPRGRQAGLPRRAGVRGAAVVRARRGPGAAQAQVPGRRHRAARTGPGRGRARGNGRGLRPHVRRNRPAAGTAGAGAVADRRRLKHGGSEPALNQPLRPPLPWPPGGASYSACMALFRSAPTPRKRAVLQRDTLRLRLSDGARSEVLRVRDPRARRIRLTVSEGRVRLTLPRWASAHDGAEFLRRNRAWIEEQLRIQAARAASCRPLAWGDPGPVPLRGVSRPLRWDDGLFARADLAADGSVLVTAPRGAGPAALGAAFGALLEAEARRDLGRWLPRYLPSLPRAPLS